MLRCAPTVLPTRTSLRSTRQRCFSSAPQQSKDAREPNRDRAVGREGSRQAGETTGPWWSLASLHRRAATILATSLPESSRLALQQSLSATIGADFDGPTSHSVSEAIVAAQARDKALKQQSSLSSTHSRDRANDSSPPNFSPQLEWIANQKKLEKEMEQRALETARERMRLEIVALEEQWKKKEEDRRRKQQQEHDRQENERLRSMAFQKWQHDVAKERQRLEQSSRHEPLQHDNNTRANTSSSEAQTEAMQSSHEPESPAIIHPILGPQLACLHYKRIHLTSATTLASLPVYEKQRAYRHDRAQLMAKEKKKTLWMGIPGVISLMEDDDGRLCILDGQHRVGMMALLSEEQKKIRSRKEKNDHDGENGNVSETKDGDVKEELDALDLENILVEVYPHRPKNNSNNNNQNEQDAKATIFTEINKAEPVKLLDLPGVTNKRTRDIIDHAASHFQDVYPVMFSASQRCRAPHLNLDNLRDALFASEIIRREKIGSGGELVKWMSGKNDELRERYGGNEARHIDGQVVVGVVKEDRADWSSSRKVSEAALKKARKHDFYLGLESTWLYK